MLTKVCLFLTTTYYLPWLCLTLWRNLYTPQMYFASFLSGEFITVIVVNPPERKLCSKQENDKNQHYSTEPIMSRIKTIFISIFSIPYLIELKFCEISCLGHGLITSKYLRCGCRIVLDCLSNILLSFKVTYPECSKHWPYTVRSETI